MQQTAWIFMLGAWSIIGIATAYCFYKLLTSKRRLDGEPAPAGEGRIDVPESPLRRPDVT
jgi:hypothetical protein